MSVLTLAGKPINWDNPPAPTAKVMWSHKSSYGRDVTGSLRTIAHIDHLFVLAMKKYNSPLVVIQPPYNTSVAASAGTHDYDACFDWYIPNVGWDEQQRFGRANGCGCWVRRPPAFDYHMHGFTLPEREGSSVSDDFAVAGFKVGKYVDGGYSLFGRLVASSQIGDYYAHRSGLAGHARDNSWFPADIGATIFDLNAYIARQRTAQRATATEDGPDQIANLNTHGPLARLGGKAGAALWLDWEEGVRKAGNKNMQKATTVLIAADTNKHGALPNLGAGLRRLGGAGIDLLAMRRATGGASIKVLRRKRVDLKIDGHDGHGVKIKVTFPSGKSVTYWNVSANIGRKADAALVRASLRKLRKAFGANAVYNLQEIDEADVPDERSIVREVFGEIEFRGVGMGTRVPTLVGRRNLRVVRYQIIEASDGMKKVSPERVITETVLAPK